MEVYDGQAMFAPGNTVSKGEVIVSGVMQDNHNIVRTVYARAKVIAQVYEQIVVEVPLDIVELVPAASRWTPMAFASGGNRFAYTATNVPRRTLFKAKAMKKCFFTAANHLGAHKQSRRWCARPESDARLKQMRLLQIVLRNRKKNCSGKAKCLPQNFRNRKPAALCHNCGIYSGGRYRRGAEI
jgi:hypothetical protein